MNKIRPRNSTPSERVRGMLEAQLVEKVGSGSKRPPIHSQRDAIGIVGADVFARDDECSKNRNRNPHV